MASASRVPRSYWCVRGLSMGSRSGSGIWRTVIKLGHTARELWVDVLGAHVKPYAERVVICERYA
eukprot:512346-Prymnesium_polylepis.2